MIKYREILRLDAQEVSKRGIAASCKCSRNTIVNVNLTMYIFACLRMHNFTRFQKLNDA